MPAVEDCSFDPASAFQRHYSEDIAYNGTNAVVDEEELIKAAKAQLKQGRRMHRSGKSQIASELLKSGNSEFTERIAEINRQRPGGFPSVEIEYKDLRVEADALVGNAGNPSVW